MSATKPKTEGEYRKYGVPFIFDINSHRLVATTNAANTQPNSFAKAKEMVFLDGEKVAERNTTTDALSSSHSVVIDDEEYEVRYLLTEGFYKKFRCQLWQGETRVKSYGVKTAHNLPVLAGLFVVLLLVGVVMGTVKALGGTPVFAIIPIGIFIFFSMFLTRQIAVEDTNAG